MVSQPTHKTALVTGGNKGIGYAICQGLLNAEFSVFLTARDADQGEMAVESLSAEGRSVQLIVLDITDDESIKAATGSIAQMTGSLNLLVNNAGIYPDEGVDILTVPRTVLTQAMNTNAFSPLRMTQAFLPFLEKADSSKVINISSGNGQLEGISANVPSYSLSKLALNGATLLLANSLRPKGIAVYAMCPGWVKTDMGGPSAPRSPEEGADTAIWLATSAGMGESGKFFRDRTQQPY